MNPSIFPSLNFRSSKGFTLLELIVSIGLFLVAVFLGIGAIASMYSANNKSQSLTSVTNNLNYAIEGMVRNIKFAKTYYCNSDANYNGSVSIPSDCLANGGQFISVANSLGNIKYRFVTGGGKIEVSEYGGAWKAVTGSDIVVQYARFYVGNAQTIGDRYQPYVIIVMKGYSGGKPSVQTSFDIETWISQRPLDI